MITIEEGDKRKIAVKVKRLRGPGPVNLTTPERRILDVNHALVTGFDWAAASWDPTSGELFAVFDSTQVNLTAAGTYYMQLRGVIGSERYGREVKIVIEDWGP